MAEDQSSDENVIAGLSRDDITPNVYEGGFKTWECSIDLAQYLITLLRNKDDSWRTVHRFIEVQPMQLTPQCRLSSLSESTNRLVREPVCQH